MRMPKTEKAKFELLKRTGLKEVDPETSLLSECCGTRSQWVAGKYIGFKYMEAKEGIPVSTRAQEFLIPDAAGSLLIEWDDV